MGIALPKGQRMYCNLLVKQDFIRNHEAVFPKGSATAGQSEGRVHRGNIAASGKGCMLP
jgi:hypothetical protein